MNNRFPVFTHMKEGYRRWTYSIENYFKNNFYINLNLTNNQLYLKEKKDSITDTF